MRWITVKNKREEVRKYALIRRPKARQSEVVYPTLPIPDEMAGRVDKSVLVTGGTGFIGRRVVEALLGRGARVRALVRPGANSCRIPMEGQVEIHCGDLLDPSSLDGAFDGVDAVVHLAADVRGPVATNVEGTQNLLMMMGGAGVDRLVLASSFSVYDWDRVGNVLDEDSPVRLDDHDLQRYGDYAQAKVLQERMVRDHCGPRDWKLTVLRPGVVWGKDSAYLPNLGHRFGPIHLVLASGLSSRMTHVFNCADAFGAALANERSIGQTFNIVDGHQISERVYLGRYFDSRGEWGVRVSLPYGLALTGVQVVHALAAGVRARDRLPSILVPCRFRSRFRRVDCPATRIFNTLGWAAPYDLPQCLEATFGRLVE